MAAKRSAGKRQGGKSTKATVTLRMANPGGAMAAKKKGGGHKKGKGGSRKKNPRRGHHKRRRNPATFMGTLGHLLGGAAVAVVTGAAVLAAQAKWAQPTTNASTGVSTPNNLALYGIPAAAVAVGALIAKKAPTIGAGVALGAVAGPFAMPVYAKVAPSLTASSSTTTTTTARALRAVQLGGYLKPADTLNWNMRAVHLGAIARAHASYY